MNNVVDFEPIIIVCFEAPENLPPIITLARMLKKINNNVILITSSMTQKLMILFNNEEIEFYCILPNQILKASIFQKYKFFRILKYFILGLNFNFRYWRFIKKLGPKYIWIGSSDTAMVLGPRLFNLKYILHAHELLDKHIFRKFFLKLYSKHASVVVVPNNIRSTLLKYWFKLKCAPKVLPNKPLYHPREKFLDPSYDISTNMILQNLQGKKIVLYQGIISANRPLSAVAEAINILGNDWCFAVMGRDLDNQTDLLKSKCPNTIFLPHIPAPYHLEITSHAYVGIISYDETSLNNIFCAPNKIWEYSGFGIPMLCADLPGLSISIDSHKSGFCVDINDTLDVINGLRLIEEKYKRISENCHKMFDSVNCEIIVKEIITNTYL